MDNHNELSHQESESESGSSYAGSDLSPDRDRFPPPSSERRTRDSNLPESQKDGVQPFSRQNEMRSGLNVSSDAQGSQDGSMAEDHNPLVPPIADNEHTSVQGAQLGDVESSTSGTAAARSAFSLETTAGHGEVVQPLSSATQSLYNAFDVERNPGIRSASASTPALTSGILLSENDSPGPQSSATIVPVPGPGSPIRRNTDGRDIVLPRWQPDAEVTYCPICRAQFSFFVRKHHCRKCGRVVCNSCSPHRITIPYQFIVQPPPATHASTTSPSGPSTGPRESESVLADRHGGMKVRLCNPCVPDPNTLPPQQPVGDSWRGGTQPTYYLNSGDRRYAFGEETMNNLERTSNPFARDNPARARGLSAGSGLSSGDRRDQQTPGPYSGRAGTVVFNNSLAYSQYPNAQSSRFSNQTASHTSRPVSYMAPSQVSSGRGHTRGIQSLSFNPTNSAPNPNPQPHYRSLLDADSQRAQPSNLDTRPLPAIPRLAEEDECPVCHRELPSRALPNFEDARAGHVTQCIEEQIAVHNGQARPGAYTSQSQPTLSPPTARPDVPLLQAVQPPSDSSSAQIVPSRALAAYQTVPSQPANPTLAPIANTPEARMAAREAAHAAVVLRASQSSSPSGDIGRRTGMFLYKASEKDCVDDAECTICLEEFEVGVGMARLECLCRFHAKCIRGWFVDHPGRCPVHQHDGYGF